MGVELELGEMEVPQGGVIVLECGWVLRELLKLETKVRFRVGTISEGQAGRGRANLELGFQLQLLFEPGDFDLSAGGRIGARYQGESIPVIEISLV